MNKVCAILSVGNEVVEGKIRETNTEFLCKHLKTLGIDCVGRFFLPDHQPFIEGMLHWLKGQADLLVLTGGLGATDDDCTREAIANVTGRPLLLSEPSLDKIRSLYQEWKIPFPDKAKKQAYFPEKSMILQNPCGTADGFLVPWEDQFIAALPGVPQEMEAMFNKSLFPYIKKLFYQNRYFVQKELMVYGITETEVGIRLEKWMKPNSNPQTGVYVSTGTIKVVITAWADSEQMASVKLDEACAEIRQRLSPWIYGEDNISLQEKFAQELKRKGLRLTVIEEFTDGTLCAMLKEPDLDGEICLKGYVGNVQACLQNRGSVAETDRDLILHIGQAIEHENGYEVTFTIKGSRSEDATMIRIPKQLGSVKQRIAKTALFHSLNWLRRQDDE